MPKAILRYSLAGLLILYVGHATAVLEPRGAMAEESARHPFPPRGTASASGYGEAPARTGGWWTGAAGAALALAAVGGLSVAARRFLPAAQAGTPGLRVLGRTSLSPRHAVYLVRTGDRVLVLGTGPHGPPSLLGELDDEPAPGGEA